MILEVFLYIIVLLYGIAIGSFLNVCIYRIPLGEEIVKTSSHCMTCDYKLKWYDNIPILSYVMLRGRCRSCGTKLSPQYPLIEAANGLLYVIVFTVYGFTPVSVVCSLLGSVLLVIGMIDEGTSKIPKGLLVCVFALGMAATALDHQNFMRHIIGMAAVSCFLLVVYYLSHKEAVRIEDVLFMAASGLYLGWHLILIAFFLGCAIAAVVYGIRKQQITGKKTIVLGPYLSIAVMLNALWGYSLIGWYVQFMMK